MPLQKKLEAVIESKGMAHSQICMYYIWCIYIYLYIHTYNMDIYVYIYNYTYVWLILEIVD